MTLADSIRFRIGVSIVVSKGRMSSILFSVLRYVAGVMTCFSCRRFRFDDDPVERSRNPIEVATLIGFTISPALNWTVVNNVIFSTLSKSVNVSCDSHILVTPGNIGECRLAWTPPIFRATNKTWLSTIYCPSSNTA